MTYAQAIKFLYELRWFGAKFGLENTRRLAELAGNPQDKLRFIHVAGTNGKGSTCAMLESIYRAAGLRVGLFTSPHLVSFRERIQINRELISQRDVVRLVKEFQPLLNQFPADHHPTFFEFVTVMALKYFAEQKCDLVIWETGLGGRLDATNIVTPLATVITNIGLDHQQWLGDTLEKIAFEKAGIIKPAVPVLTAAEQPEVLSVIENIARENGAPLTRVGNASCLSPASLFKDLESETGATPALRLAGEHQKQNAALALASVEVLRPTIPVSDEQIRAGLAGVDWPGRLQLIERGAQKFLLDGAHNPAGAEGLRSTLLTGAAASGAPALILGMLGDKDWRTMCNTLAPLAKRIALVTVASERSAQPADLAEACQRANPNAEVRCCDSLAGALKWYAMEPFVVITGSLYLVGEALQLLDPRFRDAGDERALNEWGAAKPEPAKP